MLEDCHLIPPMLPKLGSAIQAYFPHIPSLRQELIEQMHLPLTFMGKLRMKP
jgi:hypothetical protein